MAKPPISVHGAVSASSVLLALGSRSATVIIAGDAVPRQHYGDVKDASAQLLGNLQPTTEAERWILNFRRSGAVCRRTDAIK